MLVSSRKTRHLRQYLGLVTRWLWFLGLCGLIAALGALLVSKLQPPTYRATAQLIVDQSAPGQDPYTGLLASNQLVTTYVALIDQPVVLERAAKSVGGISAAALAQRVSVKDQPGTQIITLDVDDGNPVKAARLANAIAEAFITVQQQSADAQLADVQQKLAPQISDLSAQISDLNKTLTQLRANDSNDPRIPGIEGQLASAQARRDSLQTLSTQITTQSIVMSNSIHVFQPATPPGAPDHPKPLLNAAIAGLLGLLIAAGFVIMKEFLDDRIRTPAQVEEVTDIPLIGSIGVDRPERLLLSGAPSVRALGAYQELRTNLSFVALDKPLRTIVVTSAQAGEGKSTVALNLATSLALSGKRTLLIDADLHHPTLGAAPGVSQVSGLSLCLVAESPETILAGDSRSRELAGVHTDEHTPNLSIQTAGPTPPNPAELLQSDRMRDLLRYVLSDEAGSDQRDVVVLDTPPATNFVDAAVLASHADGTILVIDATRSREGPVLQARDGLLHANARIVGVVLNRTSAPQGSYSYRKYGEVNGERTSHNAPGTGDHQQAPSSPSDREAAEEESPRASQGLPTRNRRALRKRQPSARQ